MSPADRPSEEALEARRRGLRRASFKDGFQALAPTLIATATWGLVTGVALVKSGLSESAASWMTLLVYAGSAQLLSLPMIATGEPLLLILAAALMVNLRFVIFGAALHPYFRHLDWRKRLALGYFTSDISFVIFMSRYGKEPPQGQREHLWFYLGLIGPGWVNWQFWSLVGIFLGAQIPSDWSLEFAAVLALLAVLVPLVRTRPMAMSVLAAGLVAWMGQNLPLRMGLALAVIVGIVAGILTEKLAEASEAGMIDVSPAYAYGVIAMLVVCSIISRCGYMLFGDHMPLPETVRQALRYAPAAALTAIIVPELLPWVDGQGPVLDARLLAGLVGVLLFLRTRSMVLLIVGGMAMLWGLRALFH